MRLILISILCLQFFCAKSQGLFISNATSQLSLQEKNSIDYNFRAVGVGWDFKLTDPKKKIQLDLETEINYHFVNINYIDSIETKSYELSYNIGPKLLIELFPDWFYLTLNGRLAVHYVDEYNNHQSGGFNFSEQVGAGLQFNVFYNWAWISPQIRYRHLSNAGINDPNLGYDNVIVYLQIGKTF